MTITTIDIESGLVGWLRTDPAVTTLCSSRVYSALPRTPIFPAVRVLRVGGATPHDRPLTHDRSLVQVDVWGGTKAQASTLTERVRDRLALAYGTDLGGGVVVGALTWGGVAYDPDTSYDPARPRYRVDVQITHHRPNP